MKSLIALVIVVLLVWIGYQMFAFSLDETQKAVVFEFGKIIRVIEDAGLHFKTPFVQNVVYLDDRLLSYDIKPAPVITVDKQRLTVDSYTIWRIRDPQLFVETMGGLRANAEQRLDDIVYSLLRDVLGQGDFNNALKRDFLAQVKQSAQDQVSDFGIEVVDVRIKRADLPEFNEQAVYQRMVSERQQIAQKFRAEGEQEAQRIRAETDRKIQILVADANKTSEELKGEGDAEALQIYAQAYNQDEAFFRFWRTLESYKKSLATHTTLVLSTSSDYLRLLDVLSMKAYSGSTP